MLALSPADRESCAQDLVDAARSSFSTDQPHLAIAELTSWKETATAVATIRNPVTETWDFLTPGPGQDLTQRT